MDDFFASLDAEIAEALEKTKLKAKRDEAKRKANTVSLPTATRRRAAEEYKELSNLLAATEWASISTVAMFTEQSCDGCGSTHHIFLQYMELRQLIRKPSTQQWVRVTRPDPALPRETLLQPMTTHICSHCCEDHGFALLSANRLSPRLECVAPSPTYTQEDINAEAA